MIDCIRDRQERVDRIPAQTRAQSYHNIIKIPHARELQLLFRVKIQKNVST